MKKTNKEIIIEKLKEMNFQIGCYDVKIDKVSKAEFQKILNSLNDESTDIDIKIRRVEYVVEIQTVDDEKDFSIMTKNEYISRYGDERYDEE